MPLIYYVIRIKVELKFKLTNYCVLSTAGNYNANSNVNHNVNGNVNDNFNGNVNEKIFLLSNTQNDMFLSSLYQQETIKSYQNFLVKDLKYQILGMNVKQKIRLKLQHMSLDIFSNIFHDDTLFLLLTLNFFVVVG